MLICSPQEAALSEVEIAEVSRRWSRRWKLLQVLGVAMIALAGLIGYLNGSEAAVPAMLKLLLALGIIIFVAGFVMQERGAVSSSAN